MNFEAVEKLARARKAQYYLVRNARAVVKFWKEGLTVNDIALRLDCSSGRVREILHRYNERGIQGLYDRQPITCNGKRLAILATELTQPRSKSLTRRVRHKFLTQPINQPELPW